MNGTAHLKEPNACTEAERRDFERLVREGFAGSDEGLAGRISDAERLGFHYAEGDTLAGIAGLKAPCQGYRDDVFEKADVGLSAADCRLELGWVFVVPAHRGKGIGESLCRRLLAEVPTSCVFATTRPDNDPMIRILNTLGFARAGNPYPHVRRGEELVLFMR